MIHSQEFQVLSKIKILLSVKTPPDAGIGVFTPDIPPVQGSKSSKTSSTPVHYSIFFAFIPSSQAYYQLTGTHYLFSPPQKNSNPELLGIAGQADFFYGSKETYAAAFPSSSLVGISSKTGVVLNMET